MYKIQPYSVKRELNAAAKGIALGQFVPSAPDLGPKLWPLVNFS